MTQQTDNRENLLEKLGAAEGAECDCSDGMDHGGGGADAASGKQGLDTDIWGAEIHAGGSSAERDRGINS